MTSHRRLRVLQVSGTMYIGGAEKVIVSLSKEIDRSRFEAAVCCTHGRGPLADVITAAGVDVMLAGGAKVSPYRRALALRKVISTFAPDIVHTHGLQAMFTAGPLAMCGLMPRWVHTFHFGNYPYKNRRYMFLERLFARWVNHLVAVAEPQRQSIIQHHDCAPERIVTFHNGVPGSPKVDDPSVRQGKRDELGIPASAFVVGTIAVLTEQKGLDYLIEAGRQMLEVLPSARLVIVGSGHLADGLEARVKSLGLERSILFTGWRSDVAELLEMMDVFVMSSLWEAMPLALLEAMSAAKPIVVTDVGDNRRIVQDGRCAVLLPPGDATALANAFIELERDPARARGLADRARQAFEAHFTVARMVSRYEALYSGETTAKQAAARGMALGV